MQAQISTTPDAQSRVAIELAMLEFLTVLPEELQKAVFSPEQRK
jgi:hypothetical protein